MTGVRWIALIVVFVLLATPGVGCSTTNSGTGTAPGGGASDAGSSLCVRLTTAFCDHSARCGCDPAVVQRCRDSVATCAGQGSTAFGGSDLVASGDLIYHPEALDALLVHLADPSASCDALFIDLGLDSASVFSLGGVLTGTHNVGSPCTSLVGQKGGVSDCKSGALCQKTAGGQNRCVALVGLGGACDVGTDPERMCFDRRPPDSDNEFESSFDALVCVPTATGATTGTCRTNLDDGLPCHMDETCKSGRCISTGVNQGVCSPKLADGDTCSFPTDCQSGACGSVCGPPMADGVACFYDDKSCASGSCHAPDNQTTSKTPGVCGPKLAKALGAPCAQGYECATGVCRSSVCVERICRR